MEHALTTNLAYISLTLSKCTPITQKQIIMKIII